MKNKTIVQKKTRDKKQNLQGRCLFKAESCRADARHTVCAETNHGNLDGVSGGGNQPRTIHKSMLSAADYGNPR